MAMGNALTWLSDNNFGIVLGMILAGMMAIDMGGPFNKAAYVFGTGMLALGTDASFQIMASVMIGGMICLMPASESGIFSHSFSMPSMA